jgi:NADH-quinone oxidoreductase B subunit
MGVESIVRWARRRSPWVLHFNSGGCNGCDIEFLDALTPRYDVERLGIIKEASPRHADILVCTGPVTLKSRDRLLRIYEQIPEPKWVLAVGACACSGGIFADAYNALGGIDTVLPVDMYLTGCPCRPEAIIAAIARLLESIQ